MIKSTNNAKVAAGALGVAALLVGSMAAAQDGIGRNDPEGNFRQLSSNAKFYGGFDFAESCIYDASRDLLVVPNMGNRLNRDGVEESGWISLVNHDGSTHTIQWLTADEDTGAVINDPFGVDIVDGVLYVVDVTGGGTGGGGDPDDRAAHVTMWDVESGEWLGMHSVPESPTGFNDIAVAEDGTIYASDLGSGDDPSTWILWKIDPDGSASMLVQGEPLQRPNGVAMDNDGNVVVVNLLPGATDVQTFSPDGELLMTEHAVEGGNDGLVIMEDGTKYVSSVFFGSVSRIPPGGEAELIAVGIPGAASMCYDPGANQLVVPTNASNGLAFISLD